MFAVVDQMTLNHDDREEVRDIYGGRFRFRQEPLFNISIELRCDAEFAQKLHDFMKAERAQGMPDITAMNSRRLPSAQPRLPAASSVVDGEFIDES